MPRLLTSDEYPHGHDLGAILEGIRREVLKGSARMTHDGNPETRFLMGSVLDCNSKVMNLLNRAKALVGDMVGDMAGLPALTPPAVVPIRISGEADNRAFR